ncbi:MAG: hypothetical protein ACTHMT_15765 [Verrucomicrobiota bacterium]
MKIALRTFSMSRWINPALTLAVAALGFAGCKQKLPTAARALAKNSPVTANASAQRPAWNWDAYPPTTKMRIGMLPSQLQPKSTIAVQSPLSGTLRVYVDSPQTNLPSEFLWAEFEPEIFAAEKKSIEEARKKLEEREKVQNEIEIPRQKLQMARQIEEAKRQVDLLKYISTNKDVADLMFNVGSNNETLLRPDSLEKSQLELRLLNQSMSYLEMTNFSAMGPDLAGMRSEWERRKLEFEHRQALARFKMPFSGKLTVSIPLTDGVTEYPVNNGQELGVIRDLSTIRLRLPIANAAWMSIPGEKLTAIVRLPNGEPLDAKFSYQKIERIQNREEAVYYFQFPDEKAQMAGRLIGTDISAELWVALDEPVRIIPKLALVMRDPAIFQNRSWSAGVSDAFPGARVVMEGQTELAIVPPKEMKLSSAR